MKMEKQRYRGMEVLREGKDLYRHCQLKKSAFFCRSKSGFTLLELITTITIMVILSVISGPIYKNYSSNAKKAEGYALIGTIKEAQNRYFEEWGNYLSDTESSGHGNSGNYTSYETVLGVDARMNKYYRSFNVNLYGSGGDGRLKREFIVVAVGTGSPNITMNFNRTLAPNF